MKKNKSKKNKPAKRTLLGGATKSLKKLGKRKFSTTQKVVAGAALAAIGLSLFAKRTGKAAAPATSDTAAAEESLAAMDANA